jgi:predicted permease
MKADTNSVIIILVVLSILSFTRSLAYGLFSDDLTTLNKVDSVDDDIKKVLFVLSMLRLILAIVAVTMRQIHNDLITYVLLYIVISTIQRFYYEYMLKSEPNSNTTLYLKKFQTANAVLLFLSSLYIMKYVLF